MEEDRNNKEPQQQHQNRLEKNVQLKLLVFNSKISSCKRLRPKSLNHVIAPTRPFYPKQDILQKRKKSAYPSWPQPISLDLKEVCLQKFLTRLSMSELAEATCAVCNVRTPVQKSKKVPLSNIPKIHLLKVSDEFKNLIRISF